MNEVLLKFPKRINDILPGVLKSMNIETRIKNWQIVENWTEIVGKKIAQHAKATTVDTHNLFVEVDNPVWQSQLFLMKKTIIKKFKKYGVNIKDIKFRIADHQENE